MSSVQETAADYQRQGLVYLRAGHYDAAETCLRQAIVLVPQSLDCQVNLAAVLGIAGKLDEAEQLNAALLSVLPDDPLVLRNQAVVYANRNKLELALDLYRRLLAHAGGVGPDIVLNAAYALLKAGQWQEGWLKHEARFHPDLADKLAVLPREIALPRWAGGNVAGQRLLVIGEQGLGDQLMFARYLPALKSSGAAAIGALVSAPLADAFAQSGLADRIHTVADEACAEYDAYCFMGSLPLLLNQLDPRASWAGPYLRRSGRASFAEIGSSAGRRLRVGVV